MTSTDDTRWGLILVIWAAGLGAAAQYGKISVVFDRMAELYPQAGSSIAFTVSMVGLLGILFGVVAGMFVAAFGYRRTLVWALWIGAAMSALQAMHLPFQVFLATRVVEGMSHLGVVVAGPTLIAHVSSDKSRGLAMTLWSTFFGVAFALLVWFGLPLVGKYGVLSLFGTHAVVMAALAILLGMALRNVPVPVRQPVPKLASLPALHLRIYRSPWLVAPAAGWLFYTSCFVAILTVIPPFIDEDIRGFVLGSMPLASIAVSMTFGVSLLRYIPAVRLVQLGFLLCALISFWLMVSQGAPEACIALAGAMGLVQGGSFALVPQLNDTAADQAQASGAMAQAGNLGNTIGTPLMVTSLSLAGYSGMLAVVVALFFAGFVVHRLLAMRRRF